jgi:hypothetical protein
LAITAEVALTFKQLEALESRLLAQPRIPLHEIKERRYDEHRYDGVYLIYHQDRLVKVGKTSGREKKIERRMADRICGLSYSDSVLRISLALTLDDAHACTVQSLQVDDPLERGQLECFLMAKHCPPVNHGELRR